MNKLKELTKDVFENQDFIDELNHYVNTNTEETGTTIDGGKENITKLYQIDLDNPKVIKRIEIMANIDSINLDEDTLYLFNSGINEYEPLEDQETKDKLRYLDYDDPVDYYEKHVENNYENSLVQNHFSKFLKNYDVKLLKELKLNMQGFERKDIEEHYNELKHNLIKFKDKYFENGFDLKNKYILFDLITNHNLKDDCWYEYDFKKYKLKEVDNELIKQYSLMMIEDRKEGKSEFNNLKKYNYQKFKEFDKYFDYKLSKVLSNTFSR